MRTMLGRVAVGSWLLGSALISSFFGIEAWSERAADEALREFDAARDAAAAPIVAAPRRLPVNAPDRTLWSAGRAREYDAAVAQLSDLPEGILTIPSVGVRAPVYAGTSDSVLAVGAGRIEGTPELGADGNVGVAAHRDGHFRALKDIELGAAVLVETLFATHRYEVVSTTIVAPEDVHVLHPAGTPSLTLVTCYPFYFVGSAPERFIVRAQEVGRMAPVSPALD